MKIWKTSYDSLLLFQMSTLHVSFDSYHCRSCWTSWFMKIAQIHYDRANWQTKQHWVNSEVIRKNENKSFLVEYCFDHIILKKWNHLEFICMCAYPKAFHMFYILHNNTKWICIHIVPLIALLEYYSHAHSTKGHSCLTRMTSCYIRVPLFPEFPSFYLLYSNLGIYERKPVPYKK